MKSFGRAILLAATIVLVWFGIWAANVELTYRCNIRAPHKVKVKGSNRLIITVMA
jgi:hypothetical protein